MASIPAFVFYAGVAFAALLLLWGLAWWLRRGEIAVPAALGAAVVAYAAARFGGTPYTAAKAVQMAAPLAMLVIARPLLSPSSRSGSLRRSGRCSRRSGQSCGRLSLPPSSSPPAGAASWRLPTGRLGPPPIPPSSPSLRTELARSPTLVLAPTDFLTEQHGTRYIAWELRGGRVCISAAGVRQNNTPQGVRWVISINGAADAPPFDDLRLARRAGPYLLWRRTSPLGGTSHCPLIAVRAARQGDREGID